jgi:hypothetical protein
MQKLGISKPIKKRVEEADIDGQEFAEEAICRSCTIGSIS